MKPKATLRHLLAIAGSSLLAVTSASAQTTVNWDGDTSTAWADADNWDTAPVNDLTTNIANFNLATYGGNPVYAPNAGTTSIAGITIGASNGTMTLSTTSLSIGASGISIASGAGAFTLGGSITIGAAQSWINNSSNTFTFGAVTNGGNRLTIGGSGNSTTGTTLAGTGGLTKTGAGTLTLSGNKTYTGTTVVEAGKLVLTMAGSNNIINDSTEIFIGNGATIEYTSNSGQFNLKDGQKITGTGTTGSFLNAATNTSLLSVIALGNNTISSSGTLTFSRLDAYKAGNEITGGDIQSGGITTGTTNRRGLVIGNGTGDASTLTITGGTLTSLGGSGAADLLGNQSTGNGTLIINGGAYVNTSETGTTNLGNGTGTGSLTLTSGSATINTLVLNPGNGRSATVNLDGGTLTLNTLTSTVTGTSTRVFNFNGGEFVAAGTVTFANTITTNVKDGGAKIDTQGNTVTVSGALINFGGTSTGGLTKSGSGTLTLNAANTYTGATDIDAGTLALGASGSIANSSGVKVATGATFNVSAVSGGFVVGSGKSLGGDGAVTGAVTFDDSSIFAWNLNVANPANVNSTSVGDTLAVSGNLTDGGPAGGSVFRIVLAGSQTFADAFWLSDKSWTGVLTSANSLDLSTLFTTFSYANANGTIAAPTGGAYFSLSGSTLNFTAIPEPTTALAGLLLGLGLLRRRRIA